MGESEARHLLFDSYYEKTWPALREKLIAEEAHAIFVAADFAELDPRSEQVATD